MTLHIFDGSPCVNTPLSNREVQFKRMRGLHYVTQCCLAELNLHPSLNTFQLPYPVCGTQSLLETRVEYIHILWALKKQRIQKVSDSKEASVAMTSIIKASEGSCWYPWILCVNCSGIGQISFLCLVFWIKSLTFLLKIELFLMTHPDPRSECIYCICKGAPSD